MSLLLWKVEETQISWPPCQSGQLLAEAGSGWLDVSKWCATREEGPPMARGIQWAHLMEGRGSHAAWHLWARAASTMKNSSLLISQQSEEKEDQ